MKKLMYPCKIQWLTKGAIKESDQKRLIAEAQRQMRALHETMKFQKLSQGYRLANVRGWSFACKSTANLDSVTISMVSKVRKAGKVVAELCWCVCQMTIGTILEIIPGNDEGGPGSGVCAPCQEMEFVYPLCAQDDIGVFEGTRYKVSICQRNKQVDFCCTSSDFEEYAVNDLVVVLYIGEGNGKWLWDLNSCGNFACYGLIRNKEEDLVANGLDGEFIILPYII